jgi:hypothetical protein
VKARLFQVVENALDRRHLRELVEERALTHDSMDVTRVRQIRADMERADARRLQPHFIAAFFLEAFRLLGGTIHERELKRFEIKHVPAVIRNRDREIGRGEPVLQRYERVTFEKDQISVPGKPLAAFVCPGHPLLDATLDLIIERHRDLLKRGAILIDDADPGDQPRALFYLEHAIQDARTDRAGNRRIVSKRLQFVEVDVQGQATNAGPAPYLDYRPPTPEEVAIILTRSASEASAPAAENTTSLALRVGMRGELEAKAMELAAIHLVPQHLDEVRRRKEELIDKTKSAVQDRLTKEINYWDHRAAQLKDQELAGKVNARLNSGLARQRADELTARLHKRLTELEQERKLSPLPPVVLGGALIVPAGLLRTLRGIGPESPAEFALDTEESERRAMQAIMETERRLGFLPRDVSDQNNGYDIESAIPNSGLLRFLEVKGRVRGAKTVTITKNEILTGLNKPEEFILALVVLDPDRAEVRYVRTPFEKEPDFKATSVNYDLDKLLALAKEPA